VTVLVEVARVFGRLGVLAVGGGLGILTEMERQAVGIHGWVTHREFIDVFALSQVTPGPGMLMVVVIGLRAAGPGGALAAGLAMFGPTSVLAAVVAERWARLGAWPVMDLVRRTLAPVALGLLAAGCYTLVRLGVGGPATAALALGAALGVGWRRWSPALVVLAGGLVGLVALR
jgi:chromate transporter